MSDLEGAIDTLCGLAQHSAGCGVFGKTATGCTCSFGPAYAAALNSVRALQAHLEAANRAREFEREAYHKRITHMAKFDDQIEADHAAALAAAHQQIDLLHEEARTARRQRDAALTETGRLNVVVNAAVAWRQHPVDNNGSTSSWVGTLTRLERAIDDHILSLYTQRPPHE